MSVALRPYPEYRQSRLRWLDSIPAHWEEKRTKYLFREVDERSATGTEEMLSVSHITGVTPRRQKNVTMFMAESNAGHKLCRPGDLVVNTMWAWMGALGVAKEAGLVSPSYHVYRPRQDSALLPDYVDHLLRTRAYVSEYIRRSTGIRPSRLRLYPDQMLDISVIHPPLDEQRVMLAFLAASDQAIRRYIHDKQRLIALLNEQKQAIIDRAVTRGVDAGVRLVPSGVEGLGDVPAHWVARPLKRWAAINRRVLPENTDADYTFRYLDIGAVGTGFLTGLPERIRFGDAPSRARRILSKGDTIVSTVRTYLKAVYFIAEAADDLVASTGFAVLTPGADVLPEYLGHVLQSGAFVERVMAHSVGVAYPAIAESRLASLELALPTSLEEQRAILGQIKASTRELETAITQARRQTALVREYRTRLITDVVTGKLDVRQVACGGTRWRLRFRTRRGKRSRTLTLWRRWKATMGRRNYLIDGVSGAGKTAVCTELQRRGYQAIHGDRELAYQGDPETGQPTATPKHEHSATFISEHHIWDVDKVKAYVANQDEAITFFCGGSRNSSKFIALFDSVFVLEVDLDTVNRRIDERVALDPTDWGGKPAERELVARLHRTKEGVPKSGKIIDATAPLARVVDEILRQSDANNTL